MEGGQYFRDGDFRQKRTACEEIATVKSNWFRVFVAGQTVSDGRQITPEMIDEMVETFDPETYTPRINIEHISGYSPEPPFNGYGSVIGLKAQDDTFNIAGKSEVRHALYAQVDGNPQLVELRKPENDQKPYPSVEITGSYAGTGKTGLVGLAFTDNPASIGTQALKFARSGPGTVFSVPTEVADMKFDTDAVTEGKAFSALIKLLDKFTGGASRDAGSAPAVVTPPAGQPAQTATSAAASTAEFTALLGEGLTAMRLAMSEQAAANKAAVDAVAAEVATLKSDFASMPVGSRRSFATGVVTDAANETDC